MVVAEEEQNDSEQSRGVRRYVDPMKTTHREGTLDPLAALSVVGRDQGSIGLEEQGPGKALMIAKRVGQSLGLGKQRVHPVELGALSERQTKRQPKIDRVLDPAGVFREVRESIQGLLVQRGGSAIGGAVAGLRPRLAEIVEGLVPDFGVPVVLTQRRYVGVEIPTMEHLERLRHLPVQELAAERQEPGVGDL